MPIITVNLLEGRDTGKKKELIRSISTAVSDTLDVPIESVRVILNEMAFEDYGIAGLPVLEYRNQKSKK